MDSIQSPARAIHGLRRPGPGTESLAENSARLPGAVPERARVGTSGGRIGPLIRRTEMKMRLNSIIQSAAAVAVAGLTVLAGAQQPLQLGGVPCASPPFLHCP